jgi:hypothetical protein
VCLCCWVNSKRRRHLHPEVYGVLCKLEGASHMWPCTDPTGTDPAVACIVIVSAAVVDRRPNTSPEAAY